MRVVVMQWLHSHRPHVVGAILMAIIVLPTIWFALAYAGLPRIWSHHEHKKGKPGGVSVSYTAQGIPGDPINLEIEGPQSAIECRLEHAGWMMADAVSLSSGMRIGTSVLFGRSYQNAPVSPLYVHDQMQDVAFELDEGKSADRRHHVRFWQVAANRWLGSATFDKGVGLSLFTLQITHHIGPDVDREREAVSKLIAAGGMAKLITEQIAVPGKARRNGGGDKYVTDGQIERITTGDQCRN